MIGRAVADYRPAEAADQKIKKSTETLELKLVKTRDVLGSAREPLGFTGLLVGFAAETEHLESNAQKKLLAKGCDMVIANDVSETGIGFDSEDNEVLVIHKDCPTTKLGRASKREIAAAIIQRCEKI